MYFTVDSRTRRGGEGFPRLHSMNKHLIIVGGSNCHKEPYNVIQYINLSRSHRSGSVSSFVHGGDPYSLLSLCQVGGSEVSNFRKEFRV